MTQQAENAAGHGDAAAGQQHCCHQADNKDQAASDRGEHDRVPEGYDGTVYVCPMCPGVRDTRASSCPMCGTTVPRRLDGNRQVL